MNKKYVVIFIGVIICLIIGFDIFLYADGVPGNSISQVIIDASRNIPLIPWFVGFLMGGLTFHFFDSYVEPRK